MTSYSGLAITVKTKRHFTLSRWCRCNVTGCIPFRFEPSVAFFPEIKVVTGIDIYSVNKLLPLPLLGLSCRDKGHITNQPQSNTLHQGGVGAEEIKY